MKSMSYKHLPNGTQQGSYTPLEIDFCSSGGGK